MININYDFLLHLINNSNFDDVIIDFKNKDNNIKILLNNIKCTYNFLDGNYMNFIEKIIFNYSLINEGIYSDRELVNKKGYNSKIYQDYLQNFINSNNNNKILLNNLSDIFNISNKYLFFYNYFMWHYNYIRSLNFNIKNNKINKNTAVIVEMRNHILLKPIIYNIMYNLEDKWNLHIFCGYNNYNYIKTNFNNIEITLLPFYNLSVNLYDYIFMNKFFWEKIENENILIFQIDSYLIDNPTNILLHNNYPFIGALHKNIHNNVSYLTANKVGFNGGLSFRKKSYMLNIINNISMDAIKKYREKNKLSSIINTPINDIDIDFDIIKYYNDDSINNNTLFFNKNNTNKDLIFEDVYFSHGVELFKYKIPNPLLTKNIFVQENYCIDINNLNNIYGIHGWDKNYLNLDIHKNILKKYTIQLISKINNNISITSELSLDYTNNNPLNKSYNKIIKISPSINLLIITHNMGGGTEKYMLDVLNLNKNYIKDNYQNNTFNNDIIRLLTCNLEETNILFNNDKYKLLLKDKNFLMDKKYDIIHIHYINEPACILIKYIIEYIEKSIYFKKLIITLHDYHYINSTNLDEYHLTIYNSNCKYLNDIKQNFNNINTYNLYRNLLLRSDLILTGGYVCKLIYNYYFNLPYNIIKIVLHPEKKYYDPIINNYTELDYKNLNIGIIGAMSISKGSHMIQTISNIINTNNIDCKIFHFGLGFNRKLKDKININFIGTYKSEEELRFLLIKYKINMIWFPAYRHETYCYTLTLAMQTNIPILAYDSGTFRERLSFYKSPYMIHRYIYKSNQLYDDIIDFWKKLYEKTYLSKHNYEYKYDNIDYEKIYLLI